MNQIDKLANDIEGYINDFESGVTDKEETIKALCYYVGERARTAVEAERKKLTNENNIIAEWIVSEKEIFGGIKYLHLGKIFSTDKFVKIQFMDSKYIEVMTLLHFGEKYKICETLRGEKP